MATEGDDGGVVPDAGSKEDAAILRSVAFEELRQMLWRELSKWIGVGHRISCWSSRTAKLDAGGLRRMNHLDLVGRELPLVATVDSTARDGDHKRASRVKVRRRGLCAQRLARVASCRC